MNDQPHPHGERTARSRWVRCLRCGDLALSTNPPLCGWCRVDQIWEAHIGIQIPPELWPIDGISEILALADPEADDDA